MTRLGTLLLIAVSACGSVPASQSDGGGGGDGGGQDGGGGGDAAPQHTLDDLQGTWDFVAGPTDPDPTMCVVTFTNAQYDVLCPDSSISNFGPNCDRTESDGHIAGTWDTGFQGMVESIETFTGSGCGINGAPAPGTRTTPGIDMVATRSMVFAGDMGFWKAAAGTWDWTGSDPMGMGSDIPCTATIHAGSTFDISCPGAAHSIAPNCDESDISTITGTLSATTFMATAGGEAHFTGTGCAAAGHPSMVEPFTDTIDLRATHR